MSYAIFCLQKNKNRAVDQPCLDPLDYGIGDEPWPELLLRRGRVALFDTEDAAFAALKETLRSDDEAVKSWAKVFKFQVIRCVQRDFARIAYASGGE